MIYKKNLFICRLRQNDSFMTKKELHSYRFSSGEEPSDEMLDQLMENAAEKVRVANEEAYKTFFENLKRECDAAKLRSINRLQTENSFAQ